jgi:hypothetical protein
MSGHENEFEDEEPTRPWSESMRQIMLSLDGELAETVRSPGIPTLTSDRPTKRMRPLVINNYEDR